MKIQQFIWKHFGGRYSLLLVCTVLTLIAYPLSVGSELSRTFLHLWVGVSLLSLVLSFERKQFFRSPGILLGGATLLLALLSFAYSFVRFDIVSVYKLMMPLSILFFFYCVVLIIRGIFQERQVSVDLLCGAVTAYILIGISWAFIYLYIELMNPGSFAFSEHTSAIDRAPALFYFSFVTLTTLGYGDVLPLSGIARTFAYLQAITGVMYGAIFVAILVGNFKIDRN